jgi:hypothetical protein
MDHPLSDPPSNGPEQSGSPGPFFNLKTATTGCADTLAGIHLFDFTSALGYRVYTQAGDPGQAPVATVSHLFRLDANIESPLTFIQRTQ